MPNKSVSKLISDFERSDLSTYRERCCAISNKRGIAIFGSSFGSNESRRRLDDLTSACKNQEEKSELFKTKIPQ